MKNLKILIVDDIQNNCEELEKFLKKHDFTATQSVDSFQNAKEKASNEHFDVIISDMISDKAGLDLVNIFNELSPLLIIITAHKDWNLLKECMRNGVFDYILKEDEDAYQQVIKSIKKGLPLLKKKKFRVDRDSLYMEEHYQELAEKYAGEYIAILDEKIVASDNSYEELKKKIIKEYPYVEVYILGLPDKEKLHV